MKSRRTTKHIIDQRTARRKNARRKNARRRKRRLFRLEAKMSRTMKAVKEAVAQAKGN